MTDEKLELYHGTGNVFRDTNVPDADVKMMKVRVAAAIIHILDETKMTVRQAGKVANVRHADFTSIRNANLAGLSFEKLLSILKRLEPQTKVSFDLNMPTGPTDSRPAA